MWTGKHEAIAAKMRAQAAAVALKEALLPKPALVKSYVKFITTVACQEGIDASCIVEVGKFRRTDGKVSKPIKSAKRLAAMLDYKAAAHKQAIQLRQPVLNAAPDLSDLQIDPTKMPSRAVLAARLRQHILFQIRQAAYPPCPHCASSQVIRAGVVRRKGLEDAQQYRCQGCKRTWLQGRYRKHDPGKEYKLICYRCGSGKTENLSASPHTGRIGYCHECRADFTQGGRSELKRYHLLLQRRVNDLGLPPDLAAVALQQAYLGVLMGEGYCWSIKINVPAAKAEAYGQYKTNGQRAAYQVLAEGRIPDGD